MCVDLLQGEEIEQELYLEREGGRERRNGERGREGGRVRGRDIEREGY